MRTRRRKMEVGTLQEQPAQGYGWVEEGRSVPLRQVIFWLHLVAGVLASLAIGVMSVTGVLLAFERQIVAFTERDVHTVQPPVSGESRLALDDLVTKASAAVPEVRLSGVMLRADIAAALFLSQPEEYEGGELVINDLYGSHAVV